MNAFPNLDLQVLRFIIVKVIDFVLCYLNQVSLQREHINCSYVSFISSHRVSREQNLYSSLAREVVYFASMVCRIMSLGVRFLLK